MSLDFPSHRQWGYAVRFEWGATGAEAVAADVCVVVDVLSFTTTVSVAVERGIRVYPYRWRDETAGAYAAERDAELAVGRSEASGRPGSVSLSPASLLAVDGIERLVLPSPNGSSIAFRLAESGATVVGASLRNRSAVARHVAGRAREGATVAVVAAGERWSDGSLRPAAEDLWGAGAVLAGLVDLAVDGLSPEARMAEQSFRAVVDGLPDELHECASGRELIEAGHADDVQVAAELDVSHTVPVLDGDAFVVAWHRVEVGTRSATERTDRDWSDWCD